MSTLERQRSELCDAVRDTVVRESASCRHSLEQVAGILTDAVMNLTSTVLGFEAHLKNLDDTLVQVVETAQEPRAPTEQMGQHLSALARSASMSRQHIADAIRCLQFEDMASQLIRRSLSRLDRMRDLTTALEVAAASRDPEALDRAARALIDASRDDAASAVTQTTVAEGDIELF